MSSYEGPGAWVSWALRTVLRTILKQFYPQSLPGEENTSLLATARLTSEVSSTVKDLEDVVTYDYIIVGTGTAGCILASRLTEDPNVTVLAIEAGHSDARQLMSRVPSGLTKLFKTSADWAYQTIPQSKCEGRVLDWPRGRMIGGCSSINAMLYTRGAPDDYDEWERLGNARWGWKDIASYMKKAEKFTQSNDPGLQLGPEDLSNHGKTGPWNVSYTHQVEITSAFPDACNDVGIPKVTDINTDRGILGAAPAQTFIDKQGQRSSTAVAYLTADVVQRPNLKIASGQIVTKIICDTSAAKPKAVGIEMSAWKPRTSRYYAKATKEVIVCAGSVGTPQILKLSGIGPLDELKQHNIPVVKHLPGVGENLSDHLAFNGVTFKIDKSKSVHYLQHPIQSLPSVVQWFRSGTGPLTSQACDAFAFVRAADRDDAPPILKKIDMTSGEKGPDLELLAFSLAFIKHGRFVAPHSSGYGSISSIGLRPQSRGTVKLASSDPFAKPIIDPRALSSEYDLEMLLYGVKLALKIVKSETYQKYFQGWYSGPHHPLNWDTATDEQIKDTIRKQCETLYHPMGTAKMGHDSDAVVDDQLRVHGVQGLRIVDASIFPTPLACHPCAPVVAIAEKAADMIKNRNTS